MTKPRKLKGKVIEQPLNVHDNYNYDHQEVRDSDHFVFKRGKEAVSVRLSHPSIPELQESDPKYNAEWVRGTGTFEGREQYQHTLWNEPHRSAKEPTITNLSATPGARTDVATALGVVANHSMKKFGQVPTSSHDLSPQSHPIVSRIMNTVKGKGMEGVSTYVPHAPRNAITKEEGAEGARDHAKNFFQKDYSPYDYDKTKPVSEKEIHSGSQLMRGLFSGRHLNKQQFQQDELPLEGNK
jgi:hypothetical protein